LAEDRLSSSDKRILALWIICGILGALFAHKYFFRAFPEASVDFKVSRPEAQTRAKQFVEGLGENLTGYESTIVFSVDEQAKTYLERGLGLQEANHLMASELNIWYWDVRFFRPQQEEEFLVRISPAGKVVGYEHKMEEARKLQSLSNDQAVAAAEAFAQSKLGMNLSHWEFLPAEANSKTRPNRLDWSFTWERKDFKAKDAPYRLQVGLEGDHVGDSQEFLQVPEAWSRDYAHLRSTNVFYNQIAIIPYGFLLGGALWLGIVLARQGKTSWAAALKIGVVVAILYFLMQVNDWGAVRAGYDTHFTYASFVLRSLAFMLLAALGTGLTVSLVLPGGEPLYREAQPERLRLTKAFSLRGMRSKEFFCACVVGISLAAAHIGFIVAFYMVGSKFGVWAPQDLSYSDVVNTSFPWIAGVAIGVLAATSEEFLFRLFAIPFLHKLTGSRIAAVILPAFFWSFLHSAYPQEPGYIRGIEVGLIGIVAGLVMLRWGIVATLIWHYTVDASLVGMLLIRSDNLYFKISGIVVGLAAIAPLLISGARYLARGQFENVDDLLNRTVPSPEISLARDASPQQTTTVVGRYLPLSSTALGFLAVSVIVGGFLAVKLKREHIGDYLEVSADRKAATARADEVMRAHGQDPNSFRKAAQMVDTTKPLTNEFLYRRMPVSEINKIYAQQIPGALWRVRYFRDLQPEEFAVTLKPDGSLHAFWHILAEAAKGANLSKEEAESIALNYLLEQKKIDLRDWHIVEANSEKHPNRTDHNFVWQQNVPLDASALSAKEPTDHAYARMSVDVLGNEPADYRTFIQIPEQFERDQHKESLAPTIFRIGQLFLGLGLLSSVLIFFFKHFRDPSTNSIPWRRLLGWGFVGLFGFLVNFLFGRGIPTILDQYQTTIPFRLFLGTAAVGIFLFGVVIMGGILLLFGLAWAFAVRAFGDQEMPGWLGMPAEYYRDAFFIGLGGSAFLIGLRRLLDFAFAHWPALHRELPASFGELFDSVIPGLGLVGGVIFRGLLATGFLALVAAFVGADLKAPWLRIVLFVTVAAAMVTNWASPADFLKQFLVSAVMLGVIAVGISRIVRFNLLGLFLIVVCTSLIAGAAELIPQPSAYYKANGYGILAVLILLLAWPLMSWARRGRTAPNVA
jgi:membrane protease YdiL (CAAX protease family)